MTNPKGMEPFQFSIWDKVQKRNGYRWPGVVVGRFWTLRGQPRYVVECTVPEVRGALHIYSAKDLKRRRK